MDEITSSSGKERDIQKVLKEVLKLKRSAALFKRDVALTRDEFKRRALMKRLGKG